MSDTRATFFAGGSALEGFGAVAAIALSIVGLAGILSPTMAAIATIVIGAAALVEGGSLGTAKAGESRGELSWLRGTPSMDFQGGLATVVLGILALLGVAPITLISVAVIALGATFLLSGRIMVGLAGTVLGILAVVGLSSLPLVLVGLLVISSGLLLSGTFNTVKAASTETHEA